MPKLTDERRLQIKERQERERAFWERIEQKYNTKKKRHAECRLCGEMVTVIEPADEFAALKAHERGHPEYEEWVALGRAFDFKDIRDSIHDHDCVFVKCACLCGCKERFCVAGMAAENRDKPMLCDLCELYQGRGHVEHRLPVE